MLKLAHDHRFWSDPGQLSVADAVVWTCQENVDGQLATSTAELIGRLVQELQEAGTLSDEAVLRIVKTDHFRKVD